MTGALTSTAGTINASSVLTLPAITLPTSGGSIAQAGTAGSTTYTYVLVPKQADGTTANGYSLTTTTGNNLLGGTNYNIITLPTLPATAVSWDIYKTVTGGNTTVGRIGTSITASTFSDTAISGASQSSAHGERHQHHYRGQLQFVRFADDDKRVGFGQCRL